MNLEPRTTSPIAVTIYAEIIVVLAIFAILFSIAGLPHGDF